MVGSKRELRDAMNPLRACAAVAVFSFIGAAMACGGKVVIDDGVGGSFGSSSASTGSGGCDAKSHTIDSAGYDMSCNAASDCVPAFFGNLCQGCDCAFAAINVSDQAKYQAELSKKSQNLPPGGCFCPATPVACNAGHCEVNVP
jgi:hypothetical protein